MYCGSLFVCAVRGTIRASLDPRSVVDLSSKKGEIPDLGLDARGFKPLSASRRLKEYGRIPRASYMQQRQDR